MTYKLSEKSYKTIKKVHFSTFSDTEGVATFNDAVLEVSTEDREEMLSAINEEIVFYGMTDDNTVTEYGRELYALYDELLNS